MNSDDVLSFSTTLMPRAAVSTATGRQPDPNGRPIRRRFAADGRVRSGCLTCKARKKKCDEQQSGPDRRCKSCSRLGLVCEWLPLRTVRPAGPRAEVTKKAHAPSPPATTNSPSWVPNPSASDSEQAQDADRGHNHDDRDAAACAGPSPPKTPEDDEDCRDSTPRAQLLDQGGASAERVLLKHYLERLAPLCSILQQGGNEFCSVLLPMAIADPSVLHALYACASIHFDHCSASCVFPSEPCVSSTNRLKFQSNALRGLADAISHGTVSESTIACAIVCSTAEVISGDTSRWALHLQGAGHLLRQLGPQRLLRTADGSFLVRNFAYHDIMASLSTGRRPSFAGIYWVQDGRANPVDCLMGLANDILGRISEVCFFIADTKDIDPRSDTDIASEAMQRGEKLADALRSQTVNLGPALDRNDLASLFHHAEAFRFASLVHLFRYLGRFDTCSGCAFEAQMCESAQEILSHVSQITLKLYCEVGLIFPLFMAAIGIAGSASGGDPSSIDYIQNRLEYIEGWTNFRHVTRVREVLQLMLHTGRTDWECLLRELGWELSLA